MKDLTLTHILLLNLIVIAGVVTFFLRERLGDTWTLGIAFALGALGAVVTVWRPSRTDRPARLEDAALESSLKTVERIDKKLEKIKVSEDVPHPENSPDPHIVDFLRRRDADPSGPPPGEL